MELSVRAGPTQKEIKEPSKSIVKLYTPLSFAS